MINLRVTLSTHTHIVFYVFNTTRICVGLSLPTSRFAVIGPHSTYASPQYNLRSDVRYLQSVICSLQSAVCSLQSAVCSLQSAVCKCQTPSHNWGFPQVARQLFGNFSYIEQLFYILSNFESVSTNSKNSEQLLVLKLALLSYFTIF